MVQLGVKGDQCICMLTSSTVEMALLELRYGDKHTHVKYPPVLLSELYIHGRLTPAQKVKPNMAEFEGVLVRHPQSSTCTAVRQYI